MDSGPTSSPSCYEMCVLKLKPYFIYLFVYERVCGWVWVCVCMRTRMQMHTTECV